MHACTYRVLICAQRTIPQHFMEPLTENHQRSQNYEGTHRGATVFSLSSIHPLLAVAYIVYNQLVFKQLSETSLLAVPSFLSPAPHIPSFSPFLIVMRCLFWYSAVFSSLVN